MKKRRQCPSLDYPDIFYCQAAEGWLALGNPLEASAELDRVSPEFTFHFEVLDLRWRIHYHEKNWDSCFLVSQSRALRYPNDPRSWIRLAESHYLRGNLQKAYRVAAANLAEFPESWELLYDAACYACLIGKFDEAKSYFDLAALVGDPEVVHARARRDPNLRALCAPKKRSAA